MDTTTSAIATGAIVVAGTWIEGHGLNGKVLLGSGFLAIGLSVLDSINDKLARQFAVLVLVSALLRYGLSIAYGTGLVKKPTKPLNVKRKPI